MEKNKFHGITSLALLGIAVALAAVVMFGAGIWLGVGYLLICAVAMFAVLYSFCAKCPCQAHCGHVLPGKLARFFKRQPGPYSSVDIAVTCMALGLMLGMPQLVLWRTPLLAIAFWILVAIALVQIRSFVCRACDNVYCPLRKGT